MRLLLSTMDCVDHGYYFFGHYSSISKNKWRRCVSMLIKWRIKISIRIRRNLPHHHRSPYQHWSCQTTHHITPIIIIRITIIQPTRVISFLDRCINFSTNHQMHSTNNTIEKCIHRSIRPTFGQNSLRIRIEGRKTCSSLHYHKCLVLRII